MLLTEQDVAELLKVSLSTLRRWRLLDQGPQFLKVGALVRYKRESVDEWLATRPTGGAPRAAAVSARLTD
jgi:excisionase family DNA binding protein